MTLPVWPFSPDWTTEVRVTFEFLTEVIPSRSGKEQRIADRDVPRITIEFNAIVADFDLRSMMGMMALDQNSMMMMPEWPRGAGIQSGVSAGETVIETASAEAWMSADMEMVFIWGEIGEVFYEQAIIASRSGSEITLSAPLTQDIPGSATVYRVWRGVLDTAITSKMHGDRLSEVSVKFSVDPGFEKISTGGGAPLTYKDRELFLLEPNWQNDVTVEYDSTMDKIDYGYGRIGYDRPVAFNDRKVQFTYLGTDRTATLGFRNFFSRISGQQGEFFMPTFTEDLRLRDSASVGASQLRVIGPEVAAHYASSTVFGNIIIFHADDSYDLHEVTSITSITDSLGSDSALNISPVTTRAILLDDVRMICWLPLWRSVTDQMVLQWISDEFANIGMSLKTVENMGADA